MVPLTPGSLIAAARDLLSCDLSGETVLLDPHSGLYYGLNAVATAIWNGIEPPRTVSEIEQAIVQKFDVPPDVCRKDVYAFLQKMATAGLIEVRHGTAA